ncbi:MAG: nucleotidyltransferase substrate binding protein [Candidatus Adiutrix sp.]
MQPDIRWKQRFDNFTKAFALLNSANEQFFSKELSMLEREGIIQRFEYTYELAWKTLKDYLEYAGALDLNEVTARAVFKAAFRANIIEDEQVFINMMLSRNLVSHCYDFNKFDEIIDLITSSYFQALSDLHDFFNQRILE